MTKKRRVWMLTGDFYPGTGGGERQAQNLSRELINAGWQVEVLTRRHGFDHLEGVPAFEMVENIPVHRLYTKGGGKRATLLYVLGGWWHLLRYGRGGIYHAHGEGAAAWLAIIARYTLGGRSVVKLRSGKQAYEKNYRSGMRRWQFLRQIKWANRVIVVNSEVENYLLNLGIPRDRIVLMPNGVETALFYPANAQQKAAARQITGLPADKKVVLYVGRLDKVKGVDILVHAWARLPQALRARALLVIVGRGYDFDRLTALVEASNLGDSVILTGLQRNVLDYYHAADAFALPSRSEGLSNALAEAMSCGLPAVASAVGGALDMITDGEDGFLAPPQDTSTLTQKLELLLQHPDLPEIGRRAREVILSYADLAVTFQKLQGIYWEVLS